MAPSDYYSVNEEKKPAADRIYHNNANCRAGRDIPRELSESGAKSMIFAGQRGKGVWLSAVLSIALGFAVVSSANDSSAASTRPCNGWSAWLDRMPGVNLNPTLHVKGTCAFMQAGYKVTLKLHTPSSLNPKILTLDIVITQGIGATVPTNVPVHYRLATKVAYTAVTLLPDRVSVPVKIVQ